MPITLIDYRKPPAIGIPISDKVAHVKKAMKKGDTEGHHCHWPGCTKLCTPAQWGCTKHWFMLPKHLRNEIWKAYRPGQENSKDPSSSYLTVARKVRQWILLYQQNVAPVAHPPTQTSSKD
jgi:hypothetical protein